MDKVAGDGCATFWYDTRKTLTNRWAVSESLFDDSAKVWKVADLVVGCYLGTLEDWIKLLSEPLQASRIFQEEINGARH